MTPFHFQLLFGRRFVLVGAAFLSLFALKISTAGEVKTVRLLTIGNSFSRNATNCLGDLAKADGNVLIHRPIVVGGASMELHATKARKFESDPNDKAGVYSNGRSLKQELQADHWDFITIQQASIKSHDIANYRPYAAQLGDYVKQYAPKAELLLHQTWEYRCDDGQFTAKAPGAGLPHSQDEMYKGLLGAYSAIANELKVRMLPVGDAFHAANRDAQWGFVPDTQFNIKEAQAPALPNQTHSLNVGYQWKKQKDGKLKLVMDGHHASLAGEYLGACVWYEVLFQKSAVGNSFVPKGLDANYASFLQSTAHQAVVSK